MVGKHEEKFALVEKRGVRTYRLEDASTFVLENGARADVVVECSGSAQGLEMALRLVRPRGTLILNYKKQLLEIPNKRRNYLINKFQKKLQEDR